MSQLKLFLLGAPRLERDGTALDFDTRKAIALLAYLAIGSQSYSRDTLAALLWPEYHQSQARGSLRRTLSVLVKGIGPEQVAVDRETISLVEGNGLWVDAVEFRHCLAACQSHDHPARTVCAGCLALLDQALALYQGDFMAGFNLRVSSEAFETWHRFHSESLRQDLAAILEKLAGGYAGRGAFEVAISHARRWVALDPLDEAAHRQLMQLYAWAGQRATALRQYHTLAGLLDEALGIPPDDETQAMCRAIEENRLTAAPIEPQSDATPSPLPPRPPAPRHNLPAQTTRFIGRAAELAELTRLLAEPSCRLLTLSGPGGVGKTRLSIELAFAQREAFADGVYFVSLAPVSEAEFIIPALVEALNFSLAGAISPKAQLLHYLGQKQLLLVLDNMEQLLPHATDQDKAALALLSDILHSAPQVKLLVTSRERLNLHGEWIFEVAGLSVPPADRIDRLDAYDAALLFVQSARRVWPSFELTEEDQPAVARICRLMEGWPLGIELAAAWTHLLSCGEIVQEIERNLDFLATSAHDVPERQRSLRAAFDHSWTLLDEDERRTLGRLSVFRGGFTREAAERVAEANLTTLSALAEKSLLQRTSLGRYSLHELLRQFAAARLGKDKEEAQAAYERHTAYYLTLLKSHEQILQSNRQKVAVATLITDIDNIRAAWEQAVAQVRISLMHEATWSLWYFYELRNYYQEGETHFASAAEAIQARLATITETRPDQEEARLTGLLGALLVYQGFFNVQLGFGDEAARLSQAAVTLLRPLDDPQTLAYALSLHGLLLRTVGQFDEAARIGQEGLLLSQALAQRWSQIVCLVTVGAIAHEQGNYTEALASLNEAVALGRALGDPRLIAFAGYLFSRTALALGQTVEVERLLNEALHLARETDDCLAVGMALEQLALAAQVSGNVERAQRLYHDCVTSYGESGDTWHLAQALNRVGQFFLSLEDDEQARANFLQACRVAYAMDAYTHVLNALVGIATLQSRSGQPEQALELVRHILRHPASTQQAKERAARLQAKLTSHLGLRAIEAKQTRAQAQAFEEVVTDILKAEPALSF